MATNEAQLLQRFGARVRELRLERSLTQQQLAERCRLSVNYISEMERGLRNLSLRTLRRLAHAGLETSLSQLSKLSATLAGCSAQELARVRALLDAIGELLAR